MEDQDGEGAVETCPAVEEHPAACTSTEGTRGAALPAPCVKAKQWQEIPSRSQHIARGFEPNPRCLECGSAQTSAQQQQEKEISKIWLWQGLKVNHGLVMATYSSATLSPGAKRAQQKLTNSHSSGQVCTACSEPQAQDKTGGQDEW